MARIEGMMEALIQDRGVASTPRDSIDREDTASDSFQGESIFDARLETLGAAAAASRQQFGFQQDFPEARTRHSISDGTLSSQSKTIPVRIGSKELSFPADSDYQKYISYFFADLNPYLPCVNEAQFRSQSEYMLASDDIPQSHLSSLALNYIIFACVDVMTDPTPTRTGIDLPEANAKPPGWQWIEVADELIGQRAMDSRGDVRLVQILIWKVSLLFFIKVLLLTGAR